MPYVVTKIKNGYKVCRMDDKRICLSKRPLTLKTAKKQQVAVVLSEMRKRGIIPKRK
jgi:hypothetical protein